MLSADEPIRYFKFSSASGWQPVDAHVITETLVSLTVNGEVWLTFTCTPSDLDALAVGFLYNEGFLNNRDEIAAVDICKDGSNVDVWLRHTVTRPIHWRRTSGCTGGVTSANDTPPPVSIPDGERIVPEMLLSSMEQLLQNQNLYREAGGVHCSAITDGQTLRAYAEDIGRHNTLDKLAGRILLDNVQSHPLIVVTTGRISSEMLQKSAKLGATAVVSRTSPTSQSVTLAQEAGITLVGYARRTGFQVYTHPERLTGF